MKIALKHLHPNPFRDLKRLPTRPAKVEVLKQSIKDTGFWDNVVVRKANGSGYEIAYGHNRLEALRQLKWKEVDLPVRDLDDTMMAQMMARENHEEWGADADIDVETARIIVSAFATGTIRLPKVGVGASTMQLRLAPSYIAKSVGTTGRSELPFYTAETLATFLGWTRHKTRDLLDLLQYRETSGAMAEQLNFSNLSAKQAASVVRETKRVHQVTKDDVVAVEIGNQLADEFRLNRGHSGTGGLVSTDTAKLRAEQIMRERRVKRYVEERTLKAEKFNLQKENRQVKEFLDACKVYEHAIERARLAISKFSPEARVFTARRLHRLADNALQLSGRMK